MTMSLAPIAATLRTTRMGTSWALGSFALILAAGGMGCFRATGVARPSVAVEEIPASGGDRIAGLKATAAPGDFYLGNDSVQLAVDGAAFGDREGQFGSASGGAILDVGSISLTIVSTGCPCRRICWNGWVRWRTRTLICPWSSIVTCLELA